MGVISGISRANKAIMGGVGSTVKASWKPVGGAIKAPLKVGKWAMTNENAWIKYPSIAGAGLAAAGTGALIMARSGSNGDALPPEMIETQQVLDANSQLLDAMAMNQAMTMQQNPMAQQPEMQPDFQVSDVVAEGPLVTNEPTMSPS